MIQFCSILHVLFCCYYNCYIQLYHTAISGYLTVQDDVRQCSVDKCVVRSEGNVREALRDWPS